MSCPCIIQSSARKGQPCGRKPKNQTGRCGYHQKSCHDRLVRSKRKPPQAPQQPSPVPPVRRKLPRRPGDPVRKRVEEIKDEIKDEIKSSPGQPVCITRSKLKPLPHQLQIVNLLIFGRKHQHGVVAVHSIGSGKTLTAVITSQCFLDKNPGKRVIVIAPKSLIANFQKEMIAYGIQSNDPRYLFYSFQAFQSLRNHCELARNNMLIVDEAHELRSEMKDTGRSGCNRAKCVFNASQCAAKVLLLTATPVINRKVDVVNLVDIAEGRHVLTRDQVMALSDSDFSAYIGLVFSKYDASRLLYPEVRITEMEFPMSPDFLEKYREIEERQEERLAMMNMTNPKAFYTGMRTALLKLEDSPKIQYTITAARRIFEESSAKLVIYSNFKEAGVSQIANYLKARNIPFGIITGEQTARVRQQTVEAYNSGDIRILLITKAAGVGIDLKETSLMIIMDVPWSNALLQQIIGRVVRYKSHIDLPPDQRLVDIFILYSVKPDPNERPISVDAYLKKLIVDKKLIEDEVARLF